MMSGATRQKGFTILELLVVIVVIAILTSITLVGYGYVRQQAIETALLGDLDAARKSVFELKAGSKNYPATAFDANGGAGLSGSGNNKMIYLGGSDSFCLLAKNSVTGQTYFMSATQTSPIAGTCAPYVGTLAGTGAQYSGDGYVDAKGQNARFNSPRGITMDDEGNLLVADGGNRRIRQITQTGVVTTIAGNGVGTYADGPALGGADFRWPQGLTVGPDGTIYIADSDSCTIRKLDSSGIVTTVAGTPNVCGLVEGPALSAQFRYPDSVAIDDAGNLYVADGGNYRIRKITPSGTVSTLAGIDNGYINGTSAVAKFKEVNDIEIYNNTLFVSDGYGVRKVTMSGDVSTLAGQPGTWAPSADGNGTAAAFDWSYGLDIDQDTGNIYIIDKSSGQVRKVTQSGDVTTLAGIIYEWNAYDGPGATSAFAWPHDVVYAGDGLMYISDTDNSRIRVLIEP